jgi:hypothetical protein
MLFSILVFEGVYLLFFKDNERNDKRFKLLGLRFDISNKIDNSSIDAEFEKNGLKVSFKKYFKSYQIIRYIAILLMIVYLIYKVVFSSISTINVAIVFALAILTAPVLKFKKRWTLFGQIMRVLDKDLKKKQDIELSSIIIQLQNIAVSQEKAPTNLSSMLLRIVGFCDFTKAGFIKMISLIDQDREEEAKQAFTDEVDTILGRDIAHILIQLDKLNPVKVVEQLNLLEERIRNESLTIKNNKEESQSNLIYMIPVVLCFVILLNFVVMMLNSAMEFSLMF